MLLFLALLAVKAVGSIARGRHSGTAQWPLYGLIVLLALIGAREVGKESAAEIDYRASLAAPGRSQPERAYLDAARAVALRPGVLRYWQSLAQAKLAMGQLESLLKDEPAFRALSRGAIGPDDLLRFALGHYFLGQYQAALTITRTLVRQNPAFVAPRVLEGMALTALQRYSEAEQSFLGALNLMPTDENAVRGLAHAYFLAGNTARAVEVLNATSKYSFSPQARSGFDALKRLYEQ